MAKTLYNAPTSEVMAYAHSYGSAGGNKILTFGFVGSNLGSAITYVQDLVNGDRFIINEDGVYTFILNSGYVATANILGISKNASSLTTGITNLPVAEAIAMAVNGGANSEENAVFAGPLKAGDIIRAHMTGATLSTASAGAANDQFMRCCKTSNL